MEKPSKIKIILLPCSIVLLDLIFKWLINQNLESGESIPIIRNFFILTKIETHQMALMRFNFLLILPLLFKIAFAILFIRVFKFEASNSLRLAVCFIIIGWVGNYLDPFFIANDRSSFLQLNYILIDFFYIGDILGAFNLSSILTTIGWTFLVYTAITSFKEIKSVFRFRRREKTFEKTR
jgi:lipoprotein signal peptidase